MKNIWKYILAGIVVAVVGLYVSGIAGRFFNGLGGYGFGCILGICIYLCIVVVTCTGIIIAKIDSKSRKDNSSEDKEDKKE